MRNMEFGGFLSVVCTAFIWHINIFDVCVVTASGWRGVWEINRHDCFKSKVILYINTRNS